MDSQLYIVFYKIQKIHWWFNTKKNIVVDFINSKFLINQDFKILDIGCGSGLMLQSLEAIGKTYGMDMSDEAIAFSRQIFEGDIRKGSLPYDIPYDNNFFDLITALDVIEHIDDDVAALKAIYSLLRPGAGIIITVPAYMFLWSEFDVLNQHKRRYKLKELRIKLIEAGFTVDKISYFNTLLFPAVLIVRKLNKLLRRDASSEVDMPNRYINFALSKIFGIEMFLLRISNLPFGVSLIAVARRS